MCKKNPETKSSAIVARWNLGAHNAGLAAAQHNVMQPRLSYYSHKLETPWHTGGAPRAD